jgi:hypothetical protein
MLAKSGATMGSISKWDLFRFPVEVPHDWNVVLGELLFCCNCDRLNSTGERVVLNAPEDDKRDPPGGCI